MSQVESPALMPIVPAVRKVPKCCAWLPCSEFLVCSQMCPIPVLLQTLGSNPAVLSPLGAADHQEPKDHISPIYQSDYIFYRFLASESSLILGGVIDKKWGKSVL